LAGKSLANLILAEFRFTGMDHALMIFESSPWLIPLSLLSGAVYAYVLYKPLGPWSLTTRRLLAATRFLIVSFLCFLLIGPIIRQIKNNIEDPIVVFTIDNSASVKERIDSAQLANILDRMEMVRNELESQGFQTQVRTFNESPESNINKNIQFENPFTDLNSLLDNVHREFEGRNLVASVLMSDGIYNAGVSPTFNSFGFEIFSVGVGDTVVRKDVSVSNILYNQISYQGNIFPMIAEIANRGYDNQLLTVKLSKAGKVIQSRQLNLSGKVSINQVEFQVEATEEGLQHYEISFDALPDELTLKNNRKQAYVDIVAGKEKILILSLAPHPDIKAIRSALDQNRNYETLVFIPGISEEFKDEVETARFDLVVFYEIPDLRSSMLRYYRKFLDSEASILTIVGPTTHLGVFNQLNGLITLQSTRFQPDHVTAFFNTLFTPFQLSDKLQNSLKTYPPVVVPFGKVTNQVEVETFLLQKVGRVETVNPMIVVEPASGKKRAVMLATGFWRWNLNEFLKTEDHEAFNELFIKLVQYLSSREDKRKFKVYPTDTEFTMSEGVRFETEIYNELYERIYNNKVDLTLTNPAGSQTQYSYVPTESQSQYTVRGLDQGIYKYTARTEIGGTQESVSGEFLVRELELESLNLTADFTLLRNLSKNTGGVFLQEYEIEQLNNILIAKDFPGVIHSAEAYLPLINMKYLFFIALVLISLEWFTRKYLGSY
jgi:hypothetical protein